MKILKAQKYPEDIKHEIVNFAVSELRTIPPEQWLKDRMDEFGYNQSFSKHGMIYPITVSTDEPEWVSERIVPKCPHHVNEEGNLIPGLYVHTGNKRVVWAKEQGYDFIEGYLIIDKDEKGKIRGHTNIAHGDIPK